LSDGEAMPALSEVGLQALAGRTEGLSRA